MAPHVCGPTQQRIVLFGCGAGSELKLMMEQAVSRAHTDDVSRGERFEFGKNWSRFLTTLDDQRIAEAERAITSMLELPDLTGKRFLDIGSGSGLSSLAARRLGASVHSFDYDPHSVACTTELRRRYFPHEDSWK